jgi:antitoxin VapB
MPQGFAVDQSTPGPEVAHAADREDLHEQPQAGRAPAKDFQFDTTEVFVRKIGGEVILSPGPSDWSAYLATAPVASAELMEGVEDLPGQERGLYPVAGEPL